MSNTEVDLLTESLSKALIQRGELQAENARLRAVLQQVEFIQQQVNLPRICPWCGGVWQHRNPCARQLELGLQEEQKP